MRRSIRVVKPNVNANPRTPPIAKIKRRTAAINETTSEIMIVRQEDIPDVPLNTFGNREAKFNRNFGGL